MGTPHTHTVPPPRCAHSPPESLGLPGSSVNEAQYCPRFFLASSPYRGWVSGPCVLTDWPAWKHWEGCPGLPALARQHPEREGHWSEEWAGPVAVMINGKEGHLLVLLGTGHDLALWTPGLQPGEVLSRGPACWAWTYPQRSRILRAYSAKPPSAAFDRHTMKNGPEEQSSPPSSPPRTSLPPSSKFGEGPSHRTPAGGPPLPACGAWGGEGVGASRGAWCPFIPLLLCYYCMTSLFCYPVTPFAKYNRTLPLTFWLGRRPPVLNSQLTSRQSQEGVGWGLEDWDLSVGGQGPWVWSETRTIEPLAARPRVSSTLSHRPVSPSSRTWPGAAAWTKVPGRRYGPSGVGRGGPQTRMGSEQSPLGQKWVHVPARWLGPSRGVRGGGGTVVGVHLPSEDIRRKS